MSTHRFYCASLANSTVELDAEQAAHARKSLRLAVGDTVELFDGRGSSASATVTQLKRTLQARITDLRHVDPLAPSLTLATAVPKGPRADTLIDAAAQLGVDVLIPLVTTRSVVDPGEGKQRRFERIALEAAKQCHRDYLMQLEPPTDFAKVLRTADHDTKLIADAPADNASPPAPPNFAAAKHIIVLIGPEGGWTDEERQFAAAANFRRWSFGPHVMRIETAALAAAAIIRASSHI
jgi:16S rRNA (uracil1498-N3)-methyltransferase